MDLAFGLSQSLSRQSRCLLILVFGLLAEFGERVETALELLLKLYMRLR